ncbi:DUF6665 family protein [Mesorhizobium mediterraneum]|uniref:DUF6665 family protein n=1 Tax=Mesorhizobium mediterraneum TaxID=43617 RepID=UPI001785D445|nr:DUF6665 family protein [Mesorhizobium mediterraneum]
MPQNLSTGLERDTGSSALDYEILAEKAQTLGLLGRQLEQSLEQLRRFDALTTGENRAEQRATLLNEAAYRAWAFMVHRELCGVRNWDEAVKDYSIPGDVLSRMGAFRRPK